MRTLVIHKRPGDILPIWMDWSDWLAYEATQLGGSVTISTSAWVVESDAVDPVAISSSPAPSHTSTVATAWIDGGSADAVSSVAVNTITTSQGHTVSRSIEIRVS